MSSYKVNVMTLYFYQCCVFANILEPKPTQNMALVLVVKLKSLDNVNKLLYQLY